MKKDGNKLTLAQAKAMVNKSIEKGGIVGLDGGAWETVEAFSTGAFVVDKATCIGGFPRGRITELFGMPSSGKTTLMLSSVAEAQKADKKPVLYLDFEHAFDPEYAKLFGVDLREDRFLLSQPENFENGMKMAELYIENELCSMVIFDSLAAMITEKELAGEVGDQFVAIQARAMSAELKRMTGMVKRSNVCVVFINHLRSLIGGVKFVKKTTTPGGVALKFYASMRMELVIVESIKGKVLAPI